MSTLGILDWVFFAALALGATLGIGTVLGGGADSADADVEADLDADGEFDADGEADPLPGAASPIEAWWSALGLGRVPLGLLLTINLFLFGGVGLVASQTIAVLLPSGIASFVALPLAVVVAPLLGGRLVAAVARNVPALETYGASPDDLIGRLGHAELRIDERFGRAKVLDEGGALHFVRCVSKGPALEPGAELVLTDRDPLTGAYSVESSDFVGEGSALRRLG